MKLESFKDKKVTRRKMILISLGLITIIGVSLLLYKTFASFSSEVSFRIMSGKVNYYGNGDVLFGFYNGETKLNEMPQKDNPENLSFERAECDNGASVEWNEEEWGPIVLNLNKTKTKCTLYFSSQKEVRLDRDIPLASNGADGLYTIEHNNLSELASDWNKTEYRYVGKNPDNYVSFNNEIWRIIGLVNVETASGIEQRLKIIRTNEIENQNSLGFYAWDVDSDVLNGEGSGFDDWINSTLKEMLNGIYYNSESGICYDGDADGNTGKGGICHFESIGILPESQKMIDDEVTWGVGKWTDTQLIADKFYEKERSTDQYENATDAKWTKENDPTYHNGIGLMYASDYGYAVGGEERNTCLENTLYDYDTYNCFVNNWLKASDVYQWLLLPLKSGYSGYIHSDGYVYNTSPNISTYSVWPTLYLSKSVIINGGSGKIDDPFALK